LRKKKGEMSRQPGEEGGKKNDLKFILHREKERDSSWSGEPEKESVSVQYWTRYFRKKREKIKRVFGKERGTIARTRGKIEEGGRKGRQETEKLIEL